MADAAAPADNREAFARITAELHRNGVRAPCGISGSEAPRIALSAGCASRQIGGHDGSITRAALARLGDERAVGLVVDGRSRPPSFTRGWRALALPGRPSPPGIRAYLSPAAALPTVDR